MCRKYNYVNVFMVWLWYSILFFVNNIEFMEVLKGITEDKDVIYSDI